MTAPLDLPDYCLETKTFLETTNNNRCDHCLYSLTVIRMNENIKELQITLSDIIFPVYLFDSYQTRKSMQLFPGKYKVTLQEFDQKDKEKNQCCFMAAEVIGETGNDRIYIFKTYRHVSRCVLFYPVDF